MRVRRLTSQHSNLSWVVFVAWMRARERSPYPELFNPDESKSAEKMLELAILSLFRLR
jgi:hypothetical protein